MLIGNILIGVGIVSLVALAGLGLLLFWKKLRYKKPQGLVIDVDYYAKETLEGFGFIVEGKVVLSQNKTPIVFSDKLEAAKYLRDKYGGKDGGIVYQKWEPKTRTVKIGRVVDGQYEYKKSESHAGESA